MSGFSRRRRSVGFRTRANPLANIICAICFFALLGGTSTNALGWGVAGHKVIAAIAEAHLSEPARNALRELLQLDAHNSLPEIAGWADDQIDRRPETASWHFVPIPLEAASYDPIRDCRADDCIVARIDAFRHDLAQKEVPPATRLVALKFLVSLVGDLHQPLNTIDHHDHCGSEIRVLGFGGDADLHSIWDVPMVESDDIDDQRLAQRLNSAITPDDVTMWKTGFAADWAVESHAIGRQIYQQLHTPSPPATLTIPGSYFTAERPVAELQLKRAGIRLAMALDWALK
jgi:S1/P1 Nuclease